MSLSNRIERSYRAALLETKPGEQIWDISPTFCQELDEEDKAEWRVQLKSGPVNNCQGISPKGYGAKEQ